MNILKSLLIAGLVALTPTGQALAQDRAATSAAETSGDDDTVTSPGATGSDVVQSEAMGEDAETPSFPRMAPTPGIGQPVDAGIDFQPQATEDGQQAYFMSNYILLPIITVISLFVLGLLLWVVVKYRRKAHPVPSKTSHNTLIEIIWTLVPVLILAGIAIFSVRLLLDQYRPAPADAVTIKVTGYQWYWGYEYPDHGIAEIISKMLSKEDAEAYGEPHQLAVDNRMVVPVGETVKLLVTGADVIHSFAVPSLWTKMDAVPGRLNEVTFKVTRPGVYYGQCSELCGVDHGYMPIAVEALPPAQFAAWVASKGGTMPGSAERTAAANPVPAESAASGEAATVEVNQDNANNSGRPATATD